MTSLYRGRDLKDMTEDELRRALAEQLDKPRVSGYRP